MKKEHFILFCENLFEKNQVDVDFEDELLAAEENGFKTILFCFEELTDSENFKFETKKIQPVEELTDVIYRGWMLTPKQYSILYNNLLSKNYKLVNNGLEYQHCHYLPDSLELIVNRTPRTVFEKFTSEKSILNLIEKVKLFKNNPVIIKDYVKSEKHDWETACFVPDASDTVKLNETINNFIRLRGKYLNEGIVVREFLDLNDLTIHSKSGMPLTEEYRLFFYNQKLIGIYDYWEEGEYSLTKPDTKEFEELAKNIQSNFFSMDIARKKNGELIIIELGDGQVAGLPDNTNRHEFFQKLKVCIK